MRIKQTVQQTIQQWHTFVETGNHKVLDDILAQKVIFHSPVLHTQQKGKAITKMYLGAAYLVFKEIDFIYKKQILQENQAVLEFETTIDGIVINGVDIIECNEHGEIIEFKVMIRPLQALQKLHQKMMEMLQQNKT